MIKKTPVINIDKVKAKQKQAIIVKLTDEELEGIVNFVESRKQIKGFKIYNELAFLLGCLQEFMFCKYFNLDYNLAGRMDPANNGAKDKDLLDEHGNEYDIKIATMNQAFKANMAIEEAKEKGEPHKGYIFIKSNKPNELANDFVMEYIVVDPILPKKNYDA